MKDAILENNEGFPTNTKVQIYIYLSLLLVLYFFQVKCLLNIFISYYKNCIGILHSPLLLLCYYVHVLPFFNKFGYILNIFFRYNPSWKLSTHIILKKNKIIKSITHVDPKRLYLSNFVFISFCENTIFSLILSAIFFPFENKFKQNIFFLLEILLNCTWIWINSRIIQHQPK